MQISLSVDNKALIAALERLGREARPALTQALNRAAKSTATQASRLIREELNVKADAVKKSIYTSKANAGRPEASIRIAGRPIGLTAFIGTRQVRKGVSVKVTKRGGRSVIPRAFIATMKSGHRGVFWREKSSTSYGKDNRGGLVGRLGISERFSLAVQQALKTKHRAQLVEHARKRIEIELRSQIQFRAARSRASR